ncbi:hypothetical protein [Actinokineospora inagensis]|uniref:hypothetical protein n=1 Tax=Actinokineospora inagensis TaxID=103730 RepID=UPI00040D9668|nr:hypothetical protein [Actinokineospora inagensis]
MSFTVDPVQIGLYAGIIGNHHADAVAAAEFAERNLHIGAQPGLLRRLTGVHDHVRAEIVAVLGELADVCAGSRSELDRTWREYDRVDHAEAEHLDQTYPDPGPPPTVPALPGIPTGTEPLGVRQYRVPTGRLGTPEPPAEFPNPFDVVNDLGDLVSVTNWAQEILDATIHVDPVAEITRWFAGDWEQFARTAAALNSLSWFCADLASDQRVNIAELTDHWWRGHAANSAFGYFTALADHIDTYATDLAALRDRYTDTAHGAYETAEALRNILQNIADSVFWAALSAAAGTLLTETVVGPAALWSLAALECRTIVASWQEATRLLTLLETTAQSLHGALLQFTNSPRPLPSHPFPPAYDHPGA